MPKTGKTGCKVNQANVKVSRANAQSRLSGILIAPAIGKLYFEAFGINFMLQNHLPLPKGIENRQNRQGGDGLLHAPGDFLRAVPHH
jgi:hypothetical protein